MAVAQMILEYLKVLLSWPVMVAAIAIIFVLRFKEPLRALIDRVASIKMPGGAELMTPPLQADVNARESAIRSSGPSVEPTEATALEAGAQPATLADTSAEAEQRARSDRERAALWEYRYLNIYLVPRTQVVLTWLASRPPVTYGMYDSWMMSLIPDPGERSAIIRALENHHLITVSRDQGNLIMVTDKGREYLEWRGSLERVLAVARSSSPPPPPVRKPASLIGLEAVVEAPRAETPLEPQTMQKKKVVRALARTLVRRYERNLEAVIARDLEADFRWTIEDKLNKVVIAAGVTATLEEAQAQADAAANAKPETDWRESPVGPSYANWSRLSDQG